ncbi:DUF3575 domain-containing protein [uncultured Bacteroides sp.]|uniref:DUF3575 domain-containing protein n=1 Tax=uncultured Bacteroides sp. TaxID=162156 RepID=UPI002AABC612|nr:DUF3575 domain-containing protein [uncultured Bacteroides sp.]
MIKRITTLILLCSIFGLTSTVWSQSLAVKSDLLSNAFFSPNVSFEQSLGGRFSVDVSLHYNPFGSKESLKRWKHWLVQPELRLWACRPFSGHFWGIHLLAGEFNIADTDLLAGLYKGTKSWRYEGSVMGAGLSYGYQWILSPRWGLEATFGLGYVRASYDRYRCAHCGEKLSSGHKNYLGPTKVAVSLVYMLW